MQVIKSLWAFAQKKDKIAVYRDMKVDSGEVNNAFLHACLDDTVYMEIPMGMQSEFNRKKYVCQLEKCLYGLPEAAKLWADTIKQLMLKNEYKQSTYDPCLYYKGGVSNHTLDL
eukprot:427798-Amorphochlora_amoeboformis.AAC.1